MFLETDIEFRLVSEGEFAIGLQIAFRWIPKHTPEFLCFNRLCCVLPLNPQPMIVHGNQTMGVFALPSNLENDDDDDDNDDFDGGGDDDDNDDFDDGGVTMIGFLAMFLPLVIN